MCILFYDDPPELHEYLNRCTSTYIFLIVMTMSQKSLLDRIAEGEATLLGVDEICRRLSVSRATLDRWVRNGGGSTDAGRTLVDRINNPAGMSRLSDLASGDRTVFPAPDIRIGNSPRWEIETFKKWLRDHMSNPDKS